jgi:putative membrane protein
MVRGKVVQHLTRTLLAAAVIVIAAGGLGAPARAQTAATAPLLSSADFLQVMANLAAMDQRAGKVAAVLGQNNDVRRYGRDLGDDNRIIQTMSQSLGGGVSVPSANLAPAQSDWLTSLHRVDNREFDRMFMDVQVQTHEQAAAISQVYAQSGDNPAVKALAAKLAPAFQQRAAQARGVLRVSG